MISEEASLPVYEEREKWTYAWIIDPLDGTKEFIYRNGRFCINMALVEKGKPVFGMIHNVCDGEILWAFASGEKGMIKNGREEIFPNARGKKFKVEGGCQSLSYNGMGVTICRLFKIFGA